MRLHEQESGSSTENSIVLCCYLKVHVFLQKNLRTHILFISLVMLLLNLLGPFKGHKAVIL